MLAEMCAAKGINEKIKTFELRRDFQCSSAEVVNGLLDDMSRLIDEESGL